MDYEEFEYIYCISHIHIKKSEDKNHIVFEWSKNNRRECEIVEKYKDMSPAEFDIQWFPCLEKYKYKKQQRAKFIAEFKMLKPSDFRNMPDSQKFKYLDALSIDYRTAEEYTDDFSGIHENLQACLFSIKVDKSFWDEEKTKANHFLNCLIGTDLINKIKNADEQTYKQKKEDINDFINLFCQIYEVPKPKVIFKNSTSPYQNFCDASSDGKSIRLAEDFLTQKMHWTGYSIIFHEMIHIYQHVLFARDPEKYKIFCPKYTRLKVGTWIAHQGNNTEKEKKAREIYELLPTEAHAYGIETIFDDLFTQRILNRNSYRLGKIDYRNIYFGWTRD